MTSMEACEYCDRDDVTLYAWHADVWCAECIGCSSLPLDGDIADAPVGRPEEPEYARPFVWQTPDGCLVAGELTVMCREPGCTDRVEGPDDHPHFCELYCVQHRPI